MLYRDELEHDTRKQDLMAYIVMAGVQIQYKGVYPTKTCCDTVLDFVYVGEMALTLTLYPSQNESHMFSIVF
jgi:hypothetical protein